MFSIESFKLEDEIGMRYVLLEKGQCIPHSRFIDLLKHNEAFRELYTRTLESAPYEAFLWENPAMSLHNLDHDYEFVLLNSKRLATKKPNVKTYSQYFEKGKQVAIFPNLSKKSYLIAPTPFASDYACYTHLANFVRDAPPEQIDIFWKTVGNEFHERLNEQNLWLSTHGLGVSWLHVRLDSNPKYYRHQPYK